VVKVGEEAYKVVTARPKYDRMTGTVTKDLPLEVFGHWQTEIYVPPPAKDGKVPRNEYGNVELFKPWMLPKGTVHIPITGLQRVLRKLNIDAAPAMMGWDFSGGACHPVFEGYVVCTEFEDVVIDAWHQDSKDREEKAEEKREKRVVDNWRRLVKGLFIRERIQSKYMTKK
jgi:xeroderma pigmentosum group C-complementing protein